MTSENERLRAAIRLLCPDEMTPTAKRMLESILDEEGIAMAELQGILTAEQPHGQEERTSP